MSLTWLTLWTVLGVWDIALDTVTPVCLLLSSSWDTHLPTHRGPSAAWTSLFLILLLLLLLDGNLLSHHLHLLLNHGLTDLAGLVTAIRTILEYLAFIFLLQVSTWLTLSPSQSQELSTQKGLSLQENSLCLQVRLVDAASLPPQLISSPPSRQSETQRALSGQQEDKTWQPVG